MAKKSVNKKGEQITVVDSLYCFGIVTDPENSDRVVITIGNHRASHVSFENVEKAKAYIESKPYELFSSLAFEMALAVLDHLNKTSKK